MTWRTGSEILTASEAAKDQAVIDAVKLEGERDREITAHLIAGLQQQHEDYIESQKAAARQESLMRQILQEIRGRRE
jgi:F420-0:gamma-glutamyl ligase